MIKLFIAEDHKILREGIIKLVNEDPEINVVGEARDGKEAIAKIKKTDIDIVILDINMPLVGGLEVSKYIRDYRPKVKILVLSMLDNELYVSKMFKAGVSGYALKNIGKEELIKAIKSIYNNEVYISPEIASYLVQRIKTKQAKTLQGEEFTKKEVNILVHISNGLTNDEIAEKLEVSKRTVEAYRTSLIIKTGTKNTASLVKYAVLNKIVR